MVIKSCRCSGGQQGEICHACGGLVMLPYWCETCKQVVPEKRCPRCGLKAKKVKSEKV